MCVLVLRIQGQARQEKQKILRAMLIMKTTTVKASLELWEM